MPDADRVGLVVAGAGARGAYEAGALSRLLPRMAADDAPPTVLVGTSAGALNVTALAGFAHDGWSAASERLAAEWATVSMRRVADVVPGLTANAARYLGQLAGLPTRLPSLFDTRVQRETLANLLPLEQLHENVESGVVDAVAVAATSTGSGSTVVFVEASDSIALPGDDAARNIRYVRTRLTVDHVLASAAVPIAFRPVHVDGEADSADGTASDPAGWYIDGGVRLNVPLKPALRLGCGYLGVVATHPHTWPTAQSQEDGEPDVFAAASLVVKAVLVDRMIEDLHTMSKLNGLASVPAAGTTDVAEIPFLFAGPPSSESTALSTLANEAFAECCASAAGALRHPDVWALDRLIGGDALDHGDLMSFLLFEPAFTERAAALGARHAEQSLAPAPAGRRSWPTAL